MKETMLNEESKGMEIRQTGRGKSNKETERPRKWKIMGGREALLCCVSEGMS